MPAIPVSQETYSKLQSLAEPLVDTADTVITRLIDAFEAHSRAERKTSNRNGGSSATRGEDGVRARRGEVTHRDVYKDLIIKLLRDAGGAMQTREVLERIREVMSTRFLPLDLAKLPSGEERWRNAVRFARQGLIENGTLDKAAPNGTWKLKR